jgi:hypothetical protein
MTFPPSSADWYGIDPDEYAAAVEEGMLRGGATPEEARRAAVEAREEIQRPMDDLFFLYRIDGRDEQND